MATDLSNTVEAAHQPFIISEDPKIGILFSGQQDYHYLVTCSSATSCSFESKTLSPAFTFPSGATAMTVSDDVLSC